jgi:hypothetical protein
VVWTRASPAVGGSPPILPPEPSLRKDVAHAGMPSSHAVLARRARRRGMSVRLSGVTKGARGRLGLAAASQSVRLSAVPEGLHSFERDAAADHGRTELARSET